MEDVASDILIPGDVDRLVFKLLSKRPSDRYQSAEEVVAAIDQAMAALQRAGSGLPMGGQYTPVAAMTPAHPHTIPPVSSEPDATRAMAPIVEPGDEATRAMDAISDAGPEAATRFIAAMTDEPDATRAMDSVMAAGPGPAEATVALDTVDALKALERGKQQVVAPKKKGNAGKIIAILAVLALLAGGGAFAAMKVTDSNAVAEAAKRATTKAKAEAAEAAAAAQTKRDEETRKAAAKRVATERKKRMALERKLAKEKALAKVHKVTIESNPPSATVFLKGMQVGTTPYTLRLTLRDADHTLVLKLAGYEDRNVQIKARTLVEARIERLPSKLTPKAAPKPAAPKPTPPRKKKKKKLDWGM